MQVLLLKVPPPLSEELERRFQLEEANGLSLQVRHAHQVEDLPEALPPGLAVLGDPGGSLEELIMLCRQLRARRSPSRTQLVVLTQRASVELEALVQAGADECLAPPGENWGGRLLALRRRLQLDGGMPVPDQARRKVLFIDDEPAVGTAVRRLLRSAHEVDSVQDAREALKRIASGARYDAIVCDVMMPEMTGVQFFQELERSAPELARHTGLMTGGVFNTQAREFIESRAVQLLYKPFERDSLRKFVERLCD